MPLLNSFKAWLDELAPKVLPESLLGKAIRYSRNQWPYLSRYAIYNHTPVDNNVIHAVMPTLGLRRVPRVGDAQPGDAPFAVARLSALSEALQEYKQGIGRFVTRRHNAARIGVCKCALLDLHVSV